MSKAPLTVESKLTETIKKPKPAPKKEKSPDQAIKLPKGEQFKFQSYRWNSSDIGIINLTHKRVSAIAPKKISLTSMMRGALLLAYRAPSDKLLKAIRDCEAMQYDDPLQPEDDD
jgi:hypothetical protein